MASESLRGPSDRGGPSSQQPGGRGAKISLLFPCGRDVDPTTHVGRAGGHQLKLDKVRCDSHDTSEKDSHGVLSAWY